MTNKTFSRIFFSTFKEISSMKYILLLLIIFFTSCATPTLDSRIAHSSKQFPRLFFNSKQEADMLKNINRDPLLSSAFKKLLASADSILSMEVIRYEKEGRRLLSVSRTCLKRVHHLAFAYRMTANRDYLERAQKEMLAAAAFDHWNPDHFLDVAEMTAALAIGYDYLYKELTAEVRSIVKKAIINKGLIPGLEDHWWVKSHINWNQVCHAGLTLGALAIMDDEAELAKKIISRAIKYVPLAMETYAPDGAYPEGPGYWNYGTAYNVLLIAALESALGSDFGLTKKSGFLESADYYLHTTGPTGLRFNYSDGGAQSGMAPTMYWLAQKRPDRALLWNEQSRLEEFCAAEVKSAKTIGSLPFLFIWAKAHKGLSPSSLHWSGNGLNPIGIHRSDWSKDATYIAFKGGTPAASHGHMDIGSFVLDSQGVRWAEDLGSQSYHDLESQGIDLWNREQDSGRWKIFRLNNFAHNTLVVNNQLQRVEGKAPIISFSDKSPLPHTIIDMSTLYGNQLAVARRGVALLEDKSVLIQDEIQAVSNSSVRWAMLTRAEVTIVSKNKALLKRHGKTMTLHLLSPHGQLEIYESAKAPRAYDAPNPGTKMIGFKVNCKKAQNICFRVWITPSDANEKPAKKPLSQWK